MHKMLFEAVKTAITRLIQDKSVHRSVVLVSLEEIQDFVTVRIEAIEKELKF